MKKVNKINKECLEILFDAGFRVPNQLLSLMNDQNVEFINLFYNKMQNTYSKWHTDSYFNFLCVLQG